MNDQVISQAAPGIYTSMNDLLRLRQQPLPARPRRQPPSSAPWSGPRTSRFRGRGMDFAEVRAYQPGDDVRHIDWRVTARKQKVHTKVFHEERERPTLLVVDQSQSLFFGSRRCLKSVAAAETAALLAWQAMARHDRVGGLVIGNTELSLLPPARHSRAVVRLLEVICKANRALQRESSSDNGPALSDAMHQLRKLRPVGGQIFIISDFLSLAPLPAGGPEMDALSVLAGLTRHNDVCCIGVSDPLEAELPPPGDYQIRQASRRLTLNTADQALRSRHRAQFEARQSQLAERCAALGVHWLPLWTALDPGEQLAAALRM